MEDLLKASFKKLTEADRTRVEITKLIIITWLIELSTELLFVHPDIANTIRKFADKKAKEI